MLRLKHLKVIPFKFNRITGKSKQSKAENSSDNIQFIYAHRNRKKNIFLQMFKSEHT